MLNVITCKPPSAHPRDGTLTEGCKTFWYVGVDLIGVVSKVIGQRQARGGRIIQAPTNRGGARIQMRAGCSKPDIGAGRRIRSCVPNGPTERVFPEMREWIGRQATPTTEKEGRYEGEGWCECDCKRGVVGEWECRAASPLPWCNLCTPHFHPPSQKPATAGRLSQRQLNPGK